MFHPDTFCIAFARAKRMTHVVGTWHRFLLDNVITGDGDVHVRLRIYIYIIIYYYIFICAFIFIKDVPHDNAV